MFYLLFFLWIYWLFSDIGDNEKEEYIYGPIAGVLFVVIGTAWAIWLVLSDLI